MRAKLICASEYSIELSQICELIVAHTNFDWTFVNNKLLAPAACNGNHVILEDILEVPELLENENINAAIALAMMMGNKDIAQKIASSCGRPICTTVVISTADRVTCQTTHGIGELKFGDMSVLEKRPRGSHQNTD